VENIKTNIIYAEEKYFQSFYESLSIVAKERIYIEMIEAPPIEKIISFQKEHIANKSPVFYVLYNEQVIGWCDITPYKNPRLSHRGGLGMGIIPEFRGKGLGTQLIEVSLSHAKSMGLEKVEFNVYTENFPAINLYKKFGFEEEGIIRKYRKLDGQYFDCLVMAKFLQK